MTDRSRKGRAVLVAADVFARSLVIAFVFGLLFMLVTRSDFDADYVRGLAVFAAVMALAEAYVALRPNSWLARQQRNDAAERARRRR